jgi:hypothetical protein
VGGTAERGDDCIPASMLTVSDEGLIVLTLLILAAGTVAQMRGDAACAQRLL